MGAIRLFLALVVVCGHWRLRELVPREIVIDDGFKLGFNAGYAVMFFYVISGFLITYTLTRNYAPTAQGLLQFYRNRFIRIFSLYWPLVAVSFAFFGGATQWLSSGLADKLTNLFLLGADWRLVFAADAEPHWRALPPFLHQAWTLDAELTFYLLAPWFMRSWKAAIGVLLVSLSVRTAFVWQLGTALHENWTYEFLPSTFGFFMLGHLTCLAGRRWSGLRNPAVGIAMLIVCVGVMALADDRYFDSLRLLISVLAFTVALPGIFESTQTSRLLNAMGSLSYPVYLVHHLTFALTAPWITAATFGRFGTSAPVGMLSIGAACCVVIVAAIIVHHTLERWCAAALRRATRGSRARAVAPSGLQEKAARVRYLRIPVLLQRRRAAGTSTDGQR